jgi:hypothetical protein
MTLIVTSPAIAGTPAHGASRLVREQATFRSKNPDQRRGLDPAPNEFVLPGLPPCIRAHIPHGLLVRAASRAR